MGRYIQEKCEQETIINLDGGDTTIMFDEELPTASLYTADPVWIRKMDKLVKEHPENFKEKKVEYYNGHPIAKTYLFPHRFLTIRTKDIERNLTEEQRRVASDRMKALNQRKQQK